MLYDVAPTLPPWTAVLGFILGAVTGSFLNMLIYRLPRGKSLIDPAHSICPRCQAKLTALDLIPLLSWLRTGGKCRHCGEPIAIRYLLVELFVGALFAVIWVQTMSIGLDPQIFKFAAYSAVAAILVAIVFIDGELYIIPDELNAALLFIGLLYGAVDGKFGQAVAGALWGWGLIWGFVLLGRLAFGKDAMGDGDIKMMRGVGALLGPILVVADIGLGVILGLVGGIIGLAVDARRAKTRPADEESSEGDEVPYEATPIPLVMLSGAIYLFAVDVIALFVPPLSRWIASKYPAELLEEDDDWQPTATAIPFGPYLAAGALICMLAEGPISTGIKNYWDQATGASRAAAVGSGRTLAIAHHPIGGHDDLEQTLVFGSLLPRDGQD